MYPFDEKKRPELVCCGKYEFHTVGTYSPRNLSDFEPTSSPFYYAPPILILDGECTRCRCKVTEKVDVSSEKSYHIVTHLQQKLFEAKCLGYTLTPSNNKAGKK